MESVSAKFFLTLFLCHPLVKSIRRIRKFFARRFEFSIYTFKFIPIHNRRGRHLRHGIFASISVKPTVIKFIKKGKELVVLFLRNWIILMVMTLSTPKGQTEENLTCCFHAIGNIIREIFFRNRATFMGNHVIPIETSGN